MKDETLESLKQSLTDLQTQFKSAFGNGEVVKDQEEDKYMQRINSLANYVFNATDNLRSQIYRLEENMYKHEYEGHLPKIIGAEKMNNALEVLGLDGDYKAEPRVIYASNKYIINAELPKIS